MRFVGFSNLMDLRGFQPWLQRFPPACYLFTTQFFSFKDQSNEDRGNAKKKQHPQMEPKIAKKQQPKKNVKKKLMLSWNPKKHIFCSPWKKFPDSSPSPNLPFLNCQSDAMDMRHGGHSFFCMGQVGWRHWPGAKRPRKFKRLRLRCRWCRRWYISKYVYIYMYFYIYIHIYIYLCIYV